MSSDPTGMISALRGFAALMHEQKAAMESLHETSDLLFGTICRGDTDALNGIIEMRSAACVQLGKLTSAASTASYDLQELARSQHPEVRQLAADIEETSRQIDLLRIRIMTRQSECEQALRAAVADTAKQLRQTAGEKKMRTAYRTAATATPRYLDSRK